MLDVERRIDVDPRRQQFLALKKEELLREIVDNVGKRGAAGWEGARIAPAARSIMP